MGKWITILAVLIMIAAGVLFVSPGLEKRTDVYLTDFTVSEDNSEITVKTALSGSMGYIRKMETERVDGAIYCSFYSAFGGLNSRIGAKNRFEIQLDDSSRKIYFDRGGGAEALVLEKDAVSGEWAER